MKKDNKKKVASSRATTTTNTRNNKIIKHYKELKSISSTSNGIKLRAIIKKLKPELLRCIQECALNILNENVPITNRLKRTFKKNEKLIRNLAKRARMSSNKIRRYLLKYPLILKHILRPVLKLFDDDDESNI